ncbi:MAG: hypothetical protein WKG07_10665 [Hymenobacter sp.]
MCASTRRLLNDITIGNYPLKIDEYLAMGRPVVATRTRAMELFADHVYLAARCPQPWLAALRTEPWLTTRPAAEPAPASPSPKSHTWEAKRGAALAEAMAESGQAYMLPPSCTMEHQLR